jgi:hypothetical protein
MTASSFDEQSIGRSDRPVDAIAETRSDVNIVNEWSREIWGRELTSQGRNTVHKDPESR